MSPKGAGSNGKKEPFVMLPKSVLENRELTPASKLVFAFLNKESFRSGIASVSQKIICEGCGGLSRSKLPGMLAQLEKAGLIVRAGNPIKQVQSYKLLSYKEVENAIVQPKTLRRRHKVTLEPCPICKTPCVRSRATGWCKRCNEEARNQTITKGMVNEAVEQKLAERAASA